MIAQYISFISELEQNNNRVWFNLNKENYLFLQEQFKSYISEILIELIKFDSSLGFLTPSDCVFRINRDVRFSKNKDPYKTKISGFFSKSGKSGNNSGYYFEIDTKGELLVGGGQYFIDPKAMYEYRKQISKKHKDLRKIISNRNFVDYFTQLSGEVLKVCPKGFKKDDPNLDLLKRKNFIGVRKLNVLLKSDDETKIEILKSFEAISPLVKFTTSIMD